MEKITKNKIKESFKNIIEVGYCEAFYLLYFKERIFYNSGEYGWNCDIYIINGNTCLVTGYRPFGNVGNYNITKKYNNLAKEIIEDRELSEIEKREKIEENLEKYIEELGIKGEE